MRSTASSSALFTPGQFLPSDFQTAARAVLAFLRDRLDFGLWMVTRADGDDWIVLASEDRGYNVAAGSLFRWSDSFCARMIAGDGPRVAPDSSLIPAYVEAPFGRQVQIGAYVGVPIFCGGETFGTLCAINQSAMPEMIRAELPLVELLAGLLGNILRRERSADIERRRAERAEVESMTDPLTGLTNRRGWESLVEREEGRSHRYGDPAAIVMVDLDGLKRANDDFGHTAGDALLKTAARTLCSIVRESDAVARIGGDEFAILLAGGPQIDTDSFVNRAYRTLEEAGVAASIGACVRHPATGLDAAFAEADCRMLEEKERRRKLGLAPLRKSA